MSDKPTRELIERLRTVGQYGAQRRGLWNEPAGEDEQGNQKWEPGLITQAADALDRLLADLQAAEKDARRYRFWRERVSFANYAGKTELAFNIDKVPPKARTKAHGKSVDAVMDTALSAAGEKP